MRRIRGVPAPDVSRSNAPATIVVYSGTASKLTVIQIESCMAVPWNLRAAVKLRKTLKPVLKTGLSGEEAFENPTGSNFYAVRVLRSIRSVNGSSKHAPAIIVVVGSGTAMKFKVAEPLSL